MAGREKNGIVARWLDGKQRSEDYPREGVPENRWGLFWQLFKGKLGRLVLTNFIMLVTFVPVLLLVFFRTAEINAAGTLPIFGAGLGVGYPVIPEITGFAEQIVLQEDLFFFGLMIPASAIAAIGIAGGAYIIHNYVYTQKVFAMRDFLRGVKRNYFSTLQACLIFTVVLFLARLASNYADYFMAVGGNAAGMITAKVFIYLFVALVLLVCMWMVSLGVGYRQGPWALFRNAVVMTAGTFPQTVLFVALAIWPILLALLTDGFVMMIALFLLTFMSISYALLVWMDYSQWAFEKYITPDTGIATGAMQKDKPGTPRKKRDRKGGAQQKGTLVVLKRSKLMSRPIQPIDDGVELYQLSDTFSREDLVKLQESKTALRESVSAYEAAHKDEERYVSYNKQFDERERAFEEAGDKKKKKKVKRPKMLNRR